MSNRKRSTLFGSPGSLVKSMDTEPPTTPESGAVISNATTWRRKRARALCGRVGKCHADESNGVRIPELGEHGRWGVRDWWTLEWPLEDADCQCEDLPSNQVYIPVGSKFFPSIFFSASLLRPHDTRS